MRCRFFPEPVLEESEEKVEKKISTSSSELSFEGNKKHIPTIEEIDEVDEDGGKILSITSA